MSISYNTGTQTAPGGAHSSIATTIPAGVLNNDFMLLGINAFNNALGTLSIGSTGSSWTQLGSTTWTGQTGGTYQAIGAVFYCVASATDAGKVVTVSDTQSDYFQACLVAYTGVNTSTPIDVWGNTFSTSNVSDTCPSKTTGVNNDWAVYICQAGPSIASGPGTQRELANNSGTQTAIYDSNGSVGASGTSIGGGTFTAGTGSGGFVTWTIGLAPSSGVGPAAPKLLMASFP